MNFPFSLSESKKALSVIEHYQKRIIEIDSWGRRLRFTAFLDNNTHYYPCRRSLRLASAKSNESKRIVNSTHTSSDCSDAANIRLAKREDTIHVLRYLRHHIYQQIVQCQHFPKHSKTEWTRNDLSRDSAGNYQSSFFWHSKLIWRGYRDRQLYVFYHKDEMIGFMVASCCQIRPPSLEKKTKSKCPVTRSKTRVRRQLYIDLFEIFEPFRNQQLGQQIISILKSSRTLQRRFWKCSLTEIQLDSLPAATRFWKKCNFQPIVHDDPDSKLCLVL
jgi:hypothetical protein